MEPRSIERGKINAIDRRSTQRSASMEPRSIERGKKIGRRHTCYEVGLQWSRDQLNAESVDSILDFLGEELLQWSRDQLNAERLDHLLNVAQEYTLQWSRDQLNAESPFSVSRSGGH